MNEQQLENITDRLLAANKWPWYVHPDGVVKTQVMREKVRAAKAGLIPGSASDNDDDARYDKRTMDRLINICSPWDKDNASFIANAPTDIEALLNAVALLKKQNETLRLRNVSLNADHYDAVKARERAESELARVNKVVGDFANLARRLDGVCADDS